MVMTLTEVQAQVRGWADSVNGTPIDFDGAYGAQCVDAALHYAATVHGYERILGHGIALAGNYISTYGWGDIPVSQMRSGDMVSLNWGGTYGHVMVLVEKLADGRWLILDQNSRGTGDAPSGPCEIRTVSLASGVVRVARPPAYMGATSTAPAPAPTLTAAQILAGGAPLPSDLALFNADALVRAAARAGVPLHLAAALMRQETGGRNIYGNDFGGVFGTSTTVSARYDKAVTEANYAEFYARAIQPKIDTGDSSAGELSNGVGPSQITFWALHRDAKAEGLRLWDPEDNMFFGLRIFAGYLKGDYTEASVKLAATRYNRGPAATTVNQYGLDVWAYALRYQTALAGASTGGGGTTPTPSAPVTPSPTTPGVDVTTDPGALPMLAAATTVTTALPTPGPGPARVAAPVTTPTARVHFRDQVWTPLRLELHHKLQIPGPDQSPIGAPIVAAVGQVVLARPFPVSAHGWSVWHDNPPQDGEPIRVDLSDDGGWTWTTKFTGTVRGTEASVTDRGITVDVTDLSRRLAARLSCPPLNFRQPSPVDGWPYMRIGLHPVYFANLAARAARFYCTPPTPAGALISAPMVGSMWPERGTITVSKTLDAKGSTEGVPGDSPEYRRTPWGLSVHNVFSVYRPTLTVKGAGRLTTAHGVRALVGPVTDTISAVELWWDRVSITTMVSRGGVAVEVQSGWNTDGTRVKAFERIRPLSAAQIASGFELRVWLRPDGVITIDVDGSRSVHTAIPEWPRQTREEDLSDVRVLAPAKGAPLGGVQVVADPALAAFTDWETTFFPDVDPDHMLWGSPAMEGVRGLDLLTQMAEAALDTVWVDEVGHLNYVSRARMDARPSVRTLGLPDLVSAPAKTIPESVRSEVQVKRQQPSLFQTRMNSRAWAQVWEGPKDTLEPGGTWEQIIQVPDDEDWFHVDGSFEDVTAASVANTNRGIGSWVGGTTVSEGEDGPVEGVAPQSWYWGSASRVSHRAYKVTFGYRPPAGVTADLSLTVPELPYLHKRRVGNGPIMRARGLQTWAESDPVVVKTGAVMDDPEPYVHDGGRWVQSDLQARRIAGRLAPVLAQPIPAWGPVQVGRPDLSLSLADTTTLGMWGTTKAQRLAGIDLEFDPDSGLRQALTLRQLHP